MVYGWVNIVEGDQGKRLLMSWIVVIPKEGLVCMQRKDGPYIHPPFFCFGMKEGWVCIQKKDGSYAHSSFFWYERRMGVHTKKGWAICTPILLLVWQHFSSLGTFSCEAGHNYIIKLAPAPYHKFQWSNNVCICLSLPTMTGIDPW